MMQRHTVYLAANGGVIWTFAAWAVHGVWHCRISRSDPRPAEVCGSPNTPTQIYQEAATGIPIPRDYISFLFPSHSPRNHFSRPRRPAAAAGPADTETKYEYQMNTEFEYLGQNVAFYLVFKFWK